MWGDESGLGEEAVAPDEEECEILRGGSRVGLEGGGAEIMLRGTLVFIVYWSICLAILPCSATCWLYMEPLCHLIT